MKYWSVSILFDLLSSEKKIASPLIRVEKKFLQNWAYRVSKEAELCTISKMCKSRVWQKGNNFYKNTEILGTWKKNKSLGTSWRKSSIHFLNQCKIPLLLIPFAPNFEEIFFNYYKGRCCFLEVKRSNKIETVQYFKNYKLVLVFQGQSKITWSKVF